MFGNSGGDVGYGTQQQGYQTRSRGRGRDGPPEGQVVEGDLFGNPKRQNFRSTDPPTGVPPRGAYIDATAGGGGGGGGGNAFRSGGAGAGGYGQTPASAQPSPFARGPMNASSSVAGGGSAPGPGYGAGGYSDPGQTAQQQQQHGFGARVGFSSDVAFVPVEASGNSRGQNVMDDDDDDDDIPTRSLADDPDDVRDGGVLFGGGEGLRSRRGGGGDDRMGGGGGFGGFNAAPDTQRATWVVVWGVPPGKSNQVLIRFLQFGDVVEQRGQPGSNWLYLKYATRLQAEKALAAGHGSRLTDTVMLGVQRVLDDEDTFLQPAHSPEECDSR
ncbi:unnamed protein product [Ectocarpus sp. CCAP 1310/34]|nr:unnamed protein product [Ectocarpus sp. CCAP 1310/34]